MTLSERHRLIVEIVNDAIDLAGEARDRYLDDVCDDEAIRAEVESLLASDDQLPGDFMEVPAAEQVNTSLDEMVSPLVDDVMPEQIGPYEIIEILGEGGMGVVFRGRQGEPVARDVAVKLLHSKYSPRERRRFAQECQAMARLSHPNVAALYEAAVSEDGLSYVAMELVDGGPITSWCDEHELSLDERVTLFLGVCAGVSHAHEKGLLHRDIKPSNILVTEVDGVPIAKVIDFGIAKAFDKPLLAGPAMTQESFIGSPAYASPESHQGSALGGADTRSDVFSLGVVLYELLCGTSPVNTENRSTNEVMELLEAGDFPAPSKRFRQLPADVQDQCALLRSSDPGKLHRRLEGDLDAIILKAIDHRPDKRYGSPNELVADIRHSQQNIPIDARAPTRRYRVGRYILRNKGAVAAAVMLFVALTAGVVSTTIEAQRANAEAAASQIALREAEEVSMFMIELFRSVNPDSGVGEPTTAKEVLDLGVERLQTELVDQPLVQARLLHTIGEIYVNMGAYDDGEVALREGLRLREQVLDEDHPDIALSLQYLGSLKRRQGENEAAETMLRRAVAIREKLAETDEDFQHLSRAYNNFANVLWAQANLDEAEEFHWKALELRRQYFPENHPDLAESLNNLGELYLSKKSFEDASELFQSSAIAFERELGADHPRTAYVQHNLARAKRELNLWAEAEELHRISVDKMLQSPGRSHPWTAYVMTSLFELLFDSHQFDEAAKIAATMLEVQLDIDPDSDASAIAEANFGVSLLMAERYDEAESHLRRAADLKASHHDAESVQVALAVGNLANLENQRGNFIAATELLQGPLSIAQNLSPDDSDYGDIGAIFLLYSRSLVGQGKLESAEDYVAEAVSRYQHDPDSPPWVVAEALHELGVLKIELGRDAEAKILLQEALALREESLHDDHPQTSATRAALAEDS